MNFSLKGSGIAQGFAQSHEKRRPRGRLSTPEHRNEFRWFRHRGGLSGETRGPRGLRVLEFCGGTPVTGVSVSAGCGRGYPQVCPQVCPGRGRETSSEMGQIPHGRNAERFYRKRWPVCQWADGKAGTLVLET